MSPDELKVEKHVGIEKDCEELQLLLSKHQKIGIWGMGGMGKTTIAKALFSQLFPQYDGVCFLANVRERWERIGETALCDKLLSALLNEGHHKYDLAGSKFNLNRLGNKKVLIVLDDVDRSDQLDRLCRLWNYAGPDSKLIMTTRDKQLLNGRVDEIYEVKNWGEVKSLELFSLHAFKKRSPQKGYERLSKRAVDYARGVPLALNVLGSNLRGKSTEVWDCELRKLMSSPNDSIQNVLQVSYDGLDKLQKKIFLDIAFFFKGEHKDAVIRILDACDLHATSGLKVLEDKALLTILYSGKIHMHDLIQEMGLNIVRGGSEDSRKRSRLRDIEEVSDVLKGNKVNHVVEGIQLDLSSIEDLHLNADTFIMMPNLRILRLYVPSGESSRNVKHSGTLSELSGKLRYLEWYGCHLKSLPVTSCANLLVEICLPHSHVTELWQGVKDVANLVRIDLRESKHLKKLPDLSKASKLKWVNLSGCESLCDIDLSVFSLDTLETLILDSCKNLKSVKYQKHLTPRMKISVNGCTSLMEFSVSSDLISIWDLRTAGNKLLHSSIGRLFMSHDLPCFGFDQLVNWLSFLKELKEIGVPSFMVEIDKQKLHVFFDGLTSLRILVMKDCSYFHELPDNIRNLSKLCVLILDGSSVKTLPASIKLLTNLEILSIGNCTNLESLPELPKGILYFNAENCTSLRTISTLTSFEVMTGKNKLISFMNCDKLDEPSLHFIMEGAHLATSSAMLQNMQQGYGPNFCNDVKVCFPARKVPGQIEHPEAQSITIDLPSSRSNFVGLTLYAVLKPSLRKDVCGPELLCECYLPDGTRLGDSVTTICFYGTAPPVNYPHVFMWCDQRYFNDILKIYESCGRRVSFKFSVRNVIRREPAATTCIQECGVIVIVENSCNDTNNHERHFSSWSGDGLVATDLSNTALQTNRVPASVTEGINLVGVSSSQEPSPSFEVKKGHIGKELTPETSSTIQKLDTIPADTSKSILSNLPIVTVAVNDEGQSEPSPEKAEAVNLEVQLDVLDANQGASEKDPNASVDDKEDSERERAQDLNHSQEENKEKDPEKEQNQNVQPTCSTKTSGSLSQINLEMLDKNPFSMLDIWPTNSLPSHGSEACLNTATIDEANIAMARFQGLAFEGDFKIKLSTPGFKIKLQAVVDELEKLGKSIPETFKDKVEEFTKIFNQAFEANKKHNKCIEAIGKIEASTKENRSKLAQAKEEYTELQKSFNKMEQGLPSLVESEQKLAKEEEKIAKQLQSLQHELNAIRKQQEVIQAAKLANKVEQETSLSLAKNVTSLLKNPLQEKKKLEQEQIDSEKALHTLVEAYINLKLKSGV